MALLRFVAVGVVASGVVGVEVHRGEEGATGEAEGTVEEVGMEDHRDVEVGGMEEEEEVPTDSGMHYIISCVYVF